MWSQSRMVGLGMVHPCTLSNRIEPLLTCSFSSGQQNEAGMQCSSQSNSGSLAQLIHTTLPTLQAPLSRRLHHITCTGDETHSRVHPVMILLQPLSVLHSRLGSWEQSISRRICGVHNPQNVVEEVNSIGPVPASAGEGDHSRDRSWFLILSTNDLEEQSFQGSAY